MDIGSRLLVPIATLWGIRWGFALALRRFQAEKSWELEMDTYIKALSSLGVLKGYCDRESIGERTHGDYPGASTKLREAVYDALLEIERLSAVGPFMLSQRAIDSLQSVLNAWNAPAFDRQYEVELYDNVSSKADDAINVIRTDANFVRENRPSKRDRKWTLQNIFRKKRKK